MATLDKTAPVARPPQMSANPVRRVAEDIAAEWRGRGKFPPGANDFSFARWIYRPTLAALRSTGGSAASP